MGKKKHKGHKHDRHGHDRHGPDRDAHAQAPFAVPPQVAGLAAAALKQVNTPAFQQMIAGALGAAAQAFDAKRTSRPAASQPAASQPAAPQPVAPQPDASQPAGAPMPPNPPEPPAVSGYQPHFETPEIRLSPEAAQAIEQVANNAAKAIETAAAFATQALGTASAAMERWAEKQARPETPKT